MESRLFSLSNGIRVSFIPVKGSKVAHCGWVLNVGTRSEGPNQQGLAHFVEHMLFKGTERRKAYHILNYLEKVGGDVDAFTSREKTCYYASLPLDYLDRAVELLTDILFFSTYPPLEVEKERTVIAEEIDMYRDNPEEAILEDFDQLVFGDHPLGYPILGTKESISSFGREKLSEFLPSALNTGNAIFSIAADISENRLKRILDKHLVPLKLDSKSTGWEPPIPYLPSQVVKKYTGQQAHVVLGNRSISTSDSRFYGFNLLNYFFGGPINNSLLNLNIREKYGLAYNLYSFYHSYADSGLWGVYFGCESSKAEKTLNLVIKELKKIRTNGFSSFKLDQIKRQLKGQLIMGSENFSGRMLSSAKNYLDFGKDYSLEETLKELDKVSVNEILELSEQVFDPEQLSIIKYLPE